VSVAERLRAPTPTRRWGGVGAAALVWFALYAVNLPLSGRWTADETTGSSRERSRTFGTQVGRGNLGTCSDMVTQNPAWAGCSLQDSLRVPSVGTCRDGAAKAPARTLAPGHSGDQIVEELNNDANKRCLATANRYGGRPYP